MGKGNLHSLFDRSLSCRSILDPLLVRDIASSTGDNDFAPPNLSRGSKDGATGNCLSIPVTRHKIHVLADRNATIMNRERSGGAGEFLLDGDVSGVGERLVHRDTGGKLHDLLAGAQRMKVITFGEFSRL